MGKTSKGGSHYFNSVFDFEKTLQLSIHGHNRDVYQIFVEDDSKQLPG